MPKRNAGFCRSAAGFSIVDMLATIAIITTVAAIAVPSLVNTIDNQRLGMEVRNVEREMQLARLAAVTTNRPIRVRFNCPATGQYRRVELIGSVDDPNNGDDSDTQGARRCNYTYYPYPAADSDPITRPNNDGPIQKLNSKITFTSVQTLEFWPNGTVHVAPSVPSSAPWTQIGTSPVNIVLSYGSTTKLISVNSLGRMQFQ